MKLYVYCIADESNAFTAVSLQGVSGSEVRVLKVGGFSLLVSDFPGDVVPVNRDNALTHAAVVRSLLERTTPLPFRFGALVTEQELESYVNAHSTAIKAKLEQVRGCVEMSVKIIWGREEAPEVEVELPDKPGTAFLFEKRREILGDEARAAQAKEVEAWLQGQIGALVQETQASLCPTEKLLLTASHLVKRDLVQQYRNRLSEIREERPELHFLVSGPWPPYSFTQI